MLLSHRVRAESNKVWDNEISSSWHNFENHFKSCLKTAAVSQYPVENCFKKKKRKNSSSRFSEEAPVQPSSLRKSFSLSWKKPTTILSQQSECQCRGGISLYIDCNCFSLLMRRSSHPSLFFPISGRFHPHKVVALRQPQLGFIVPAGQQVRHTSQLLFLRNKWPSHALIYGFPSQTLP